MGVSMTRQQMRAAMNDNFILYDSVLQSPEWRKMPEASYGVLWDLILQVHEPRPKELRFTKERTARRHHAVHEAQLPPPGPRDQ